MPTLQPLRLPMQLCQGGSWETVIRFSEGAPIKVTGVQASSFITECPHCFAQDQCLQIAIVDMKCVVHHLIVMATSVANDNDFGFSIIDGTLPAEFQYGLAVGAQSLEGISFAGAIASRGSTQKSPVGLIGCIAEGDHRVLVNGPVEVSAGDWITFPVAGLTEKVMVTGVTVNRLKTPPAAAGTPSSSSGCGCDCSAETLEPGCQACVQTVICLDSAQPATATVSCDAPQPLTRHPAKLADINVEFVGDDPKWGTIKASIDPDALTRFPMDGVDCGCGADQLIGCYQILAYQGWLAPRPTYKKQIYASWAAPIAKGPVWLSPGFTLSLC